MSNTYSKTLIVASLLSSVLLAGCGTTPSANNTTGSIDTTGSVETGAVKAQKVFTSEVVSYKTPDPDGGESLKVTLTTENDLIVDFALETQGQNPASQKRQNSFKEGITSKIIGKPIKDLNVGIVNGASLTSAAFNEAVSKLQG